MSQTPQALLLMLFPLLGCIPPPCPNIRIGALFVTVTSEATGADVCNATVTAAVGTKTITLKAFADSRTPGICSYQDEPGLSPAGTYTITATAPGFQMATVSTVINQGDCNTNIPQNLNVVVKPGP